ADAPRVVHAMAPSPYTGDRPAADTKDSLFRAAARCVIPAGAAMTLLALDAAFELHRLVARGPHPAVILAALGDERAAVAAHAVALHGIENLGAFVVVDVEVDGSVGLPVVLALFLGLQLHALLVHLLRLDGHAERLVVGAVTAVR